MNEEARRDDAPQSSPKKLEGPRALALLSRRLEGLDAVSQQSRLGVQVNSPHLLDG